LTRAEETYAALNEVANKHQVQFDKEYAALKEVDNTQQVQIDEQKVEMDRQEALINEQQVEIDNNKKSQVHDVARVDQHLSEHSSTLRSTTYNVGSLTKDVKSLREDADSFKEKAACFDLHEKEVRLGHSSYCIHLGILIVLQYQIKALKDGRELFEKRLAQKILRRDAIRQERIAAAYHQMAKDELREIEVEEDEALTIPGLYLVPAIAYTSLSSDKKRKAEDGEGRDGSDGGDREAKKGRLVE
jgi:hypothetical protein